MYQILLSRYEVFHKSHDALNSINPCFRKKEWEAWQETASTAHCINFKSGLAIKACLFPLLVTEVAHPVLAAIPFHDVDFFVFGIWYKLWFLDPRALYGGCTGSNYIP